jgi:hypothetical protein
MSDVRRKVFPDYKSSFFVNRFDHPSHLDECPNSACTPYRGRSIAREVRGSIVFPVSPGSECSKFVSLYSLVALAAMEHW